MNRRWLTLAAVLLMLGGAATAIVLVQRGRYERSLTERRADALESMAVEDRVIVDLAEDRESNELAEALDDAQLSLVEPGTLLVVSRLPGDDYERLAVVDDEGGRVLLPISCARAHASAGTLLCLQARDSVVPSWEAVAIDLDTPDLTETVRRPAALPSRARVDPLGAQIAYTEFVSGHSYTQTGEFSTRTIVYGLEGDELSVADNLVVDSADAVYSSEDRNWWGVSFLPDGSGDYLVTFGSQDTVEVHHYDAAQNVTVPIDGSGSCPSVSPDGLFMVYKRIDFDRAVLGEEQGEGATVELVVHELATGQERVLPEDRFVDDQVEWLDNNTIVYALERDDGETIQPSWDIWSLDLAPGATPQLLVPFASSPSVYRDLR